MQWARQIVTLAHEPGAPSPDFSNSITSAYTELIHQTWAQGHRAWAIALYDSVTNAMHHTATSRYTRQSLAAMIGRDSLVGQHAQALQASAWLNPLAGAHSLPALGKVTLIEFTSHNCGPCRASYPVLMALQKQFGARGFQVVFATQTLGFVGLDENLTPLEEVKKDRVYFVDHHHVTIPIAIFIPPHPIDFGQPVAPADANPNELAYQVSALPEIVIVDQQGMIRDVARGWDEWIGDRVKERVAELVH
jgi:thiol-disulfide isomerase/thioredoxin